MPADFLSDERSGALFLLHKLFPGEVSLSPVQIAQALNCHVRSVNRGLADGSLPLPTYNSTPSRKRVLKTELAAYMDRGTVSGVKKRGRPVGSKNRRG